MTQIPNDPYGSDPLTDLPPTTASTSGYSGGSTSGSSRVGGGSSSTTGVAKEQASQVGQEARASTQHVAGVAKDEAKNVAAEAKTQAKDLLHSTRSEVRNQASTQQQRAATGLTGLADQLSALARGEAQQGPITDLAEQASERLSGIATWVQDREPADLLREVQTFARRRPGAFLAIAAGVGFLGGRLTRGVAAAAKDESDGGTSASYATGTYPATGYADTYSTTTTTGTYGTSTGTTGGYGTTTAGPVGTPIGSSTDTGVGGVPGSAGPVSEVAGAPGRVVR